MIQIFQYHKRYGNHTVLSFDQQEFTKGIYWIKGINGSGKTTLLKSIAGIIPFDGSIKINGFDVLNNSMNYRKQVSYSEAEPVFPAFLTARELIDYVRYIRNVSMSDVEGVCKLLGVDSFVEQQCGGYSAGMHKKLSICLALLGSPEWILLDEPFAFIDDQSERQLIEIIRKMADQGSGFILTSHHMGPMKGLRITKKFLIEEKTLKHES